MSTHKKISFADKRIKEIIGSGDLKKLDEKEKYNLKRFYEEKSKNRLETARIIYNSSKDIEGYSG